MKKLCVKQDDGDWAWVFCRKMDDPVTPNKLMTCDDKSKALPSQTHTGTDDLQWAQKVWPDREFKLAEVLQ